MRPQQRQILDWFVSNWDNKRFFLVDAPPGVGKSAIAASVAEAAGRSYHLTSTRALQDQYMGMFPWMRTVKGQGNYDCNVNRIFTVNTAPCIADQGLKARCMETSNCSYYNARDEAIRSDAMITSYHYYLMAVECGPLRDRGDASLRRDVMVCDEAHELDAILAEFLSFTIVPEELKREHGIDVASDEVIDADSALAFMTGKVGPVLSSYEELLERVMQLAIRASGGNHNRISPNAAVQMRDLVAKRDRLDRLNKKLLRFTTYGKVDPDEWLITRADDRTVVSPLVSRPGFSDYMRHYTDKMVLMSASLGDPKQLMEDLGIDPEDACSISVDTPFDPAKSPVHAIPMLRLSIKDIDDSLKHVVDAIELVMDSHPTEKGIIHAGNYKIANAILERVSRKNSWRLLGRQPDQKRGQSNEELLEAHAETSSPTVLVSPSMHTGVDLKGDLSRFQVIVKLPWPNLTDPRVAKKATSQRWYANEMIKRLVQSSGRSTRDMDDHSSTYILDEGFLRVWRSWAGIMPVWFKERVIFG